MTKTAARDESRRHSRLLWRLAPLVLLFAFVGSAGATSPNVSVSIVSPSNGQTVSGSITWSAATSGAVSRVDFAIDGTVKWSEEVAPYVYNGDGNKLDTTTLANGNHTLSVTAYGRSNRTATASVPVTVSNGVTTPPPTATPVAVSTASPVDGSTVSGKITWQANVTSGTASRVDFAIDGSIKWTEQLAPYVFNGNGNTLDTTTLTNASHALTVTAVGTDGSTATSKVTVNVSNAVSTPTGTPPTSSALPAISGKAVVGQTLTASTGTWSGSPTSYGYQWQLCDATGAACTAVAGATASSYVATSANQGHALRVTVTASNASGSGSATSAPTSSVQAAPVLTTSTSLGTSLPARMPMSSGAGGTYYVDGTNGSDSASGSAAAPWKTINKALATVPAAGSIINVLPGTYSSLGGSYVINFNRLASMTDPITLQAQTPGTVVIANADPNTTTIGGWVHSAAGLRIEGLVFRVHATANLNQGSNGLLIENSSRIEVYHCTINEVGTVGMLVRGGQSDGQTANDVWFIDNVFRSSSSNIFAQVTGTGWTTDQYYGSKGSHWIYAGQYGTDTNWNISNGSRRLVIVNNIFTGTTAGRDIELGPQAQSSYVVNNTFYGNHALSTLGTNTLAAYAGQGVEFFTNATTGTYQTAGNLIANNLFVDLDGHAVYGSGPSEGGNVVRANLSYNLRNGEGFQGRTSMDYEALYGTTTLFTVGANGGDANPLFVNANAWDFHLQSGSPTGGIADPAYAYPFDADGNPRSATPAVGALG
jgi:hypothetical protein